MLDQLLASVSKFVSETSSKEVKTLLVAECKCLSDVPDENKLAAAKRVLKLLAQHKDMQFVLHGEAVQGDDADTGTVVDALQTVVFRCAAIFPHENAKEFCRVTTGLRAWERLLYWCQRAANTLHFGNMLCHWRIKCSNSTS